MKKYQPKEIESKWQKRWDEINLYAFDLLGKNKYYVLAEFAYPSGDLHMGHWFTWAGADIYARFKRMQGFNVFFPNGFDAFGLPAENAAIKRNIHPQDWTMSNIARMQEQYKTMGPSFTFDHEVITCLPEYYKWNQWLFLKMLEKGWAYKGKYVSNWCRVCQTVLANEGVVDGECWRCGTSVEQREVDQWFFKITDFAEELLWPSDPAELGIDWPKSVRDAQNSWIGKSQGIVIKFDDIEIFGTRQDTIFGVTFVVISPEHPLLNKLVVPEQRLTVEKYIQQAKKKTELERKENREKTGVFTGAYVKNPINGEKVPVWVADYVLMSYGTGAVMGVPGHDQRDFEFAKQFNLPVKEVVRGGDLSKAAYMGEGEMVNSGKYNGMPSNEAREKISDYLEEHQLGKRTTNYHLHDWSISRQRYWGTPIPIIHCPKCGVVPVPEKDLPVELPYEVDYTPQGKPPLASNEQWMSVKCPKCGGEAKRDPETMDTFVDSAWYFFRYISPQYDKLPFDMDLSKKIMPVNIYFGGSEHTLGHTLYARFVTKVFKALGLTDLDEFALKRVNHGIVLGPDGQKMSKSKGNVVNPDEEVKKYGTDAVRLYVSFFMPYEGTGPWVSDRIWGTYRFLERVWNLFDAVIDIEPTRADMVVMNNTIKKVGEDIDTIKFNTAVAALMEWLNYLSRKKVSKVEYRTLLLLLAPFAPYVTEELWEKSSQVVGESVHQQSWPEIDSKFLQGDKVIVVVQINGRVRDEVVMDRSAASSEEDAVKIVLKSEKVKKYLNGIQIKKKFFVPGKIINLVV